MVVRNNVTSPQRNKTSANFSNFCPLCSIWLLMARKEKRQLLMKQTIAKVAPSSMYDASLILVILLDVSTTKQKPSKLAEVPRICVDLLWFIEYFLVYNSASLFKECSFLSLNFYFLLLAKQYGPSMQAIYFLENDLHNGQIRHA